MAIDGDRRVDRGIAVHRGGGGEDGTALALPGGGIFGEIADAARTHRDIGPGALAFLHHAPSRPVIRMRALAEPDRDDFAQRRQCRLHPVSQGGMGIVVGNNGERPRQIECLDEIAFAARKRRFDHQRLHRDMQDLPRIRIAIRPVEQLSQIVH